MPEGDTVFNVAALLRPLLVGQTLVDARIATGERDWLVGRDVAFVRPRGKHLFIGLDDGVAIRSHLGLYGSWHRYAPGEPWRKPSRHASLALWTATDVLVCFHAKAVELLRSDGIIHRALLGRLGPDLSGEAPDLAAVLARTRSLLTPQTPLADVLLDQRVASGIGNVYKSETLFLARQHPLRPVGALDDAGLEGLFTLAHELLRKNLGRGPRTTRWIEDGRGTLWVYARTDKPCFECGSAIVRQPLGRTLRVTFWCEHCQSPPQD